MTNDKSAEEIVRGLEATAEIMHRSGDDAISIWLRGWLETAAALLKSQAAEIAELRAENERLAVNGGKYMEIADKRYEMYEEAIKRAEAAEIKLAAYERRTQNG